jgi:hypothetical protein
LLENELANPEPKNEVPHSKHADRSSKAVMLGQLVELIIQMVQISPKETIKTFV